MSSPHPGPVGARVGASHGSRKVSGSASVSSADLEVMDVVVALLIVAGVAFGHAPSPARSLLRKLVPSAVSGTAHDHA